MTSAFTYENITAQLGDRAVPAELDALWEFDANDGAGRDYYASGFELDVISKAGLSTWSEDPAFLDGVVEFAQADGSGSTYGFWVAEGAELADAPIVVFGGGGGVHVVAENLRELLRLLSYDAEPYVSFSGASYYRDEDDEPSERHDEYVAWLGERLGLEPVIDPDPLVERASELHQERFAAWMARYTG